MAREVERAAKLQLLVEHYVDTKPLHRETLWIQGEGGTQRFSAGRFLSSLADAVRRGEALPPASAKKLMARPWFAAWYATQKARGESGSLPAKPSINEQVELIVENYPASQPVRNETRLVERVDGSEYELNGQLVLDKVASSIHGGVSAGKYRITDDVCERLLALPWAANWVARSAERRAVGVMRKVVTKEMKLELILHYYPLERPAWDDPPICVHVPGSDPFPFRPATWIDDLADNWLGGRRPNVTLSPEQMAALESLPWVSGWLQGVIRRRK